MFESQHGHAIVLDKAGVPCDGGVVCDPLQRQLVVRPNCVHTFAGGGIFLDSHHGQFRVWLWTKQHDWYTREEARTCSSREFVEVEYVTLLARIKVEPEVKLPL